MAVDKNVKKSISIVFKRVLIPTYNKFINRFIDDSCLLTFKDNDPNIYVKRHSTPSLYKYEMVYGVGFLYNIFKYDGRVITKKQFMLDYPNIRLVLLGAFFHESAHLIFTDMKGLDTFNQMKPITRPDGSEIKTPGPLAFNLFNILEDIFIEKAMSYRYRTSKERRGTLDPRSIGSYLRENRKFIMSPNAADYTDEHTIFNLYNYLLLKLSLKSAFTGTNTFFDSHPENREYVEKFLREVNATNRIEIVIEYFNWLTTTDIEIPEGEEGDGVNPLPNVGKGYAGNPEDAAASGMPGNGASSFEDGDDSNTDSDEPITDVNTPPAPPVDNNLEDDIFDELNDAIYDWSTHQEIIMKNLDFKLNLDTIKRIENEVATMSEDLAYYFQMLIEKSKPSYITNIQSGSELNYPAITRGERLNIFKEMIDRSEGNTAGIVLLCDNSGSMHGMKADLLQKAVIAMSMMMEKLEIDNEVYAFSDSYIKNTLTLKQFEDSYNNDTIKHNFNLLGTDSSEHVYEEVCAAHGNVFSGNEDGYHIEYLSKRLEQTDYDNKIMIIFSDGMPGDGKYIKESLKRHDGAVKYIGVGLVDSSVNRFYSNVKVFKSLEELQGLPQWLGSLLLTLIGVSE